MQAAKDLILPAYGRMISFKAKVRVVYDPSGEHARQYVTVPKLTRSHCDMAWFRASKRYGGISNSDIFQHALRRIERDLGLRDYMREFWLDSLPRGVTIDTSTFLATISIQVEDATAAA
jgi:hypothetical protein